MRALLAGISGVNKDIVVANLLARLRAHGEINPLPDSPAGAAGDWSWNPRELLAASIEDTLAAQGNELAGVLAAFRPAYQLAAWQRAGVAIAERLEAADPRHPPEADRPPHLLHQRPAVLADRPAHHPPLAARLHHHPG